jgi:hypothetical protein
MRPLPTLQISHENDQRIHVIFARNGHPEKFHILPKCTTNEYKKGKGYGFLDCILDCVQKMTEPAQSARENDSIETESLD